MKKEMILKNTSIKDLAAEVGVAYQTLVIKTKLIDKIKSHCEKNSISQ